MLIKKCVKNTVYLFFTIIFAFTLATPCFALNLDDTGDWNRLVTSNYKDGFITIETSGDRITVSGVFKDNYPTNIIIFESDDEQGRLSVEDDGRFYGEIVCTPIENSYYHLIVKLDSGVLYRYVLKYNGGWTIPDNGIAEENKKKFINIVSAPPIAAAYYLSAEGDRAEIEETLSELQRIVDEVCADETDDYVKAMLLIDWIGTNIYYDKDAADTSVTMDTVAVHNVLERRRTTCAGYANTFSALLETAGIRSVNLKGAAVAGEITYETLPTGTENHEFSAFWYQDENRWVYCDPCWTSNSRYQNGEYLQRVSGKTRYFDVTDEAFALDHRIDKVEERLYTKALAALDDELDESEAQTEETAEADTKTEESAEVDTKTEVTVEDDTEKTENNQADVSETTSELRLSEKTDNDETEKEEKNDSNPAPYIIIGIVGIMVIGAGIILAVKNRKK